MVNYFEVERLFLQYTGLPDGEKWCELIAGCCDEILLREKKEQSPIGQSILNQLAAANAWYRYLLVSEGTSEQALRKCRCWTYRFNMRKQKAPSAKPGS